MSSELWSTTNYTKGKNAALVNGELRKWWGKCARARACGQGLSKTFYKLVQTTFPMMFNVFLSSILDLPTHHHPHPPPPEPTLKENPEPWSTAPARPTFPHIDCLYVCVCFVIRLWEWRRHDDNVKKILTITMEVSRRVVPAPSVMTSSSTDSRWLSPLVTTMRMLYLMPGSRKSTLTQSRLTSGIVLNHSAPSGQTGQHRRNKPASLKTIHCYH